MNSGRKTGNTGSSRRSWRWGIITVAVAALALPAYFGVQSWLAVRATNQMIEMLDVGRPARRKMAAWQAAEQNNTKAGQHIAAALQAGKVGEADVREAFLQALGRLPDAKYADLLAKLALTDPEAEVRQSAWLALAQVSPEKTRQIAANRDMPNDAWDQLGRANALVRAGDMSAVPALIGWARNGTEDQRRVASGGLRGGLVPVLETLGHWPLDAASAEGGAWSAELLDRVEQICAALDLQPAADHYHAHLAQTSAVVRDIERMTSARAWIARVLLAL